MNDVERIRTHPADKSRLPSGQTETTKWPVLTYGPTPQVSTEQWRLRIWGACANPLELDWNALAALPFVRVQADMQIGRAHV